MEEVILAVKQAEESAAQKKAQALLRAESIVSEADAAAREVLKRTEADLKSYREAAIRDAEENAENAYRVSILDQKTKAKAYGEQLLNKTKTIENRIVRRICG